MLPQKRRGSARTGVMSLNWMPGFGKSGMLRMARSISAGVAQLLVVVMRATDGKGEPCMGVRALIVSDRSAYFFGRHRIVKGVRAIFHLAFRLACVLIAAHENCFGIFGRAGYLGDSFLDQGSL